MTERQGTKVYAVEHESFKMPSKLLKRELEKLPTGTVVGLTTPKELHDPLRPIDQIELDDMAGLQTFSPHFWKDLVTFCQNKGLQVVFLTSLDTEGRLAHNRRNYDKLNLERIQSGWKTLKSDNELVPNELLTKLNDRRLAEAMYRANNIIDYQHFIERGQEIIRNIKEHGVQVAVMDIFNADFAFREGRNTNPNVWIRYVREDFHPSRRPRTILKASDLGSRGGRQEEYIRRLYRIATQWRVTNDEGIFGVGSWDLNNRCNGLFELTLLEEYGRGRFKGKVEDSLGTAIVEGRRTRDELEMMKTYTDIIFPSAITSTIRYSGVAARIGYADGYQGVWTSRERNGHFVLANNWRFPHDAF